ncbi:kelch-like protein [Corallococcus sp. bb12-1]|uniref:RCC1 domain-containing protein n=1 Tax=Corallococcus sp. bb12-1 TaxID=2996784 RepID=UPI002270F2F4|nr:kelch-like protein [Corallococcus sp. bb12-1]MCY1041709.1 kelch-like protein [Corallococcus sp. bb12-1]
MKQERRSGLLRLMAVLVVALAGCRGQEQEPVPEVAEGSAQVVSALPHGLGASDVARVEITVSGEGMTTRTDVLVRSGQQWGGVLRHIPTGYGRTFRAQAFDPSNTVRYAGQVTSVGVSTGLTTTVVLLMQEVSPPAPVDAAGALITSLVMSFAEVGPRNLVVLRATAEDSHAGAPPTFIWTAGAGTFDGHGGPGATWQAPETPGPVVLTLRVTDATGASQTLSVTVTVGTGVATVDVTFNAWPRVERVTTAPSSVAVGQATEVAVVASDKDGDGLGYQWTAGCEGTWTNATAANASFTPTAQPSDGTCTLTVTVQDGRGGQGAGNMDLHVVGPPIVVETHPSPATVPAAGGSVLFRVRAKDAQGSTLGFTWAANMGTLGTATSSATTSEVFWIAPLCVPPGTPPSVTGTVTNALGLSTRFAFALQGGAPCTASTETLAAGYSHSLALKQDGTAWAWGYNRYGQLGDGTTTNHPTPQQVPGLTGVTALAARIFHTLALKQDGTVWAWGYNSYGQLGDGTTTNHLTPQQVPGLTGVTALAAGSNHTLALKQDGTVWAWGYNSYGQLGDGTTTDHLTPQQVPGLTGVVALAAGGDHSRALKQDGTVWAWGYNRYGQPGDGTTTDRLTPVQVPGLTGVTALAAGNDHTFALKQDGTVWAWGYNRYGQLGDGTQTTRLTPVQVPGLTGVVALAAGSNHTLALKQDGTAWAWGVNPHGELGDGTWVDRFTPQQVPGLTGVVALAAGGDHTLALKQDGTVWAWGFNEYGQLGDGPATGRQSPAQVQGLSF